MERKKKQYQRSKYWFLGGMMIVLILIALTVAFLGSDNQYNDLKGSSEKGDYISVEEGEDPDQIVDGIHLRTGLKEGEGLMTVVNNCTTCHSAQLVMQNRMNEERWIATIRWMQRTQNLWELGENEKIIVDYLVTNYPPQEKGRRENLKNIEWYELKP
jgi:hypothetical protein